MNRLLAEYDAMLESYGKFGVIHAEEHPMHHTLGALEIALTTKNTDGNLSQSERRRLLHDERIPEWAQP